jgi:hypothetical protein
VNPCLEHKLVADRTLQSLIEQQQAEIQGYRTELAAEADRTLTVARQAREIERLRGVLTSIAEHGKNCSYWLASDDSEYDRAIKQGHRCAAEIAKRGLENK